MSVQLLALRRQRAMLDLNDGRYLESERDLSEIIEALKLCEEPSAGYQLGRALIDRATSRRFLNRWEAALADVDACDQLARTLPHLPASGLLPNVYSLRAKLLMAEGAPTYDPSAARSALGALAVTGNSWVREAEADLAFRERDWQTAADAYDAVGDALARQRWQGGVAACELQSGTALLELSELDEAGARLRRAAAYFEAHGPSDLRANAERQLARLIAAQGQPDAAWAHATVALSLVEAAVRSFKGLFDQQRFVTDKQTYYQHAFAVGLAAGGPTGIWRAWSVAERAKSFYLCQLIANADVPLFDGVDAVEVDALHELEDRLDVLQSQTAWARDDQQKRETLELQRTEVAAERDELLARIMRDHPRWASTTTPLPFDPEHELGSLPPDWSAFSMFWLGDSELHMFHSGSAGAPFHRAETWSVQELDLLRSVQAEIRRASPADLFLVDRVIPESIAAKILPADVVAGIPPDARLLVSPHGALRAIPLHAVTCGDTRPLLGHAVQYIPSLALLGLMAPQASGSRVLVLGCESDAFNGQRLTSVPDELEAIEHAWMQAPDVPVDRISLARNSRLGVDTPPLEQWSDYRLLHLACHGELHPDRPLDAALLLGESALRCSELFALRLRAEAVFLSACDLGGLGERLAGVHDAGDEWLGFTMPLLYAGARSILVSLWKADDHTAARLMPAIHAAMRDGLEPADCLRNALATVAGSPEAFWSNWYLVGFPAGLTGAIAKEAGP